jgi:Surface lipoprotein assembly modifier
VGLARRGLLYELPYSTGLQFSYDFITLGDTKFVQRWTVNPYFTLVENAANLTTLYVRLRIDDFFNDRALLSVDRHAQIRDAVNYMAGPLHFFLFDEGRHYIKLGYQYDANVAVGDDWDYSGHRFLFGTQYTLPWGDVRLRYDLDFHLRFYSNKDSLLPVTAPGTIRRYDREPIHLFSVSKDFTYKAQNFTVSVEYLLDNNASNLAAYEYDRNVVTTSLTWRF